MKGLLSRTLKILALGLGLLVVLLTGAVVFLRTPDLPHDLLVERYGGPPSSFVELPSGAVAHLRDRGRAEGEVLMLIHGSNASLHTWEAWAEVLGRTLRVVSLDLPGHGLTGAVPGDDYSTAAMVRFVDEVRSTLGVASMHVAGSSMGGHVAWRYAVAHPERVESLILVDAAGLAAPARREGERGRGGSLAFLLAATPGVNRLLETITPRALVEEGLRAAFSDREAVTEAMVDRYYELLLHPGNRRATRLRFTRRDWRRAGAAAELAALEVPALVLSGEDDRLVPVEVAHRFHELLPHSQLVVYPGVGHVPMEEIPERSAEDVLDFLQGLVAAEPEGDGSGATTSG